MIVKEASEKFLSAMLLHFRREKPDPWRGRPKMNCEGRPQAIWEGKCGNNSTDGHAHFAVNSCGGFL
jgi:hypothetical protein